MIGILKVPKDSDDTIRTWHLHLQVRLVSYGHELDKTRYAKHGMVSVLEVDDLEEEYLLVVVCHFTKRDP